MYKAGGIGAARAAEARLTRLAVDIDGERALGRALATTGLAAAVLALDRATKTTVAAILVTTAFQLEAYHVSLMSRLEIPRCISCKRTFFSWHLSQAWCWLDRAETGSYV